MKKARAILRLDGLVPAFPERPPQRVLLHDAIAALADAGLPLFERMRAESRCLPMKIGIWADISNRTDPAVHAALKVQVEILARARPYLAACAAEGAMRHDLDSNAVEAVTPEHRQQATRLRPQRKK